MKPIRKSIPTFIKPFLRFLYYPQERSKLIREPKIRRTQNQQIRQFDISTQKLVVFLVEGADYNTGKDKISGGTISIVSLCEESKNLKSIHEAEVILCTFPKQHLLAKFNQFKNDTDVFRYDQLANYFINVKEVILHLPEYLCNHFISLFHQGEFEWIKKVGRVHINILNQNIKLMPLVKEIDQLKKYVDRVTVTTAHQQYCTPYFRALYQVPLHKFSVWISPEKYFFKLFQEKQNYLIVSPDEHPEKESILEKLTAIIGLKVQIIQNLTYEQYKLAISNAKWTLTFGEGLDGYLIEPIFSGAIGFAVYNEEFFTADFKDIPTIYKSWSNLSDRIVDDLSKYDNPSSFSTYQKTQYDLCAKYYSIDEYRRNIATFYRKEYTYA